MGKSFEQTNDFPKVCTLFSKNVNMQKTDGSKPRMLLIPKDEKEDIRFVTTRTQFDSFASKETQIECFSIGPELTLLCHSSPELDDNPYLSKYGASFPGACLIVRENEEKTLDLPDDFISQLPDVLEKDRIAREKFMEQMLASGAELLE